MSDQLLTSTVYHYDGKSNPVFRAAYNESATSIHLSTFNNYEKDKVYLDICEGIKNIIYQMKFEGVIADLLNHVIIARELNFADKVENVVKCQLPPWVTDDIPEPETE